MGEPESSVITGRYPKSLVERLEKVAKKRQVGRQVILREALETYLALGESALRVVPFHPGGFDDVPRDSAAKGRG